MNLRTRVLLIAVLLALVAIYGGSVLLSTTTDRVDQIDTKPVRAATTAACTTLRVELDARPVLTSAATLPERTERVQAEVDLVRGFTDSVLQVGPRALDKDVPTRIWLDDWQRLLTARQAYAATGFTGTFTVPVEDAQPITRRMDAIGVDACTVPRSLVESP